MVTLTPGSKIPGVLNESIDSTRAAMSNIRRGGNKVVQEVADAASDAPGLLTRTASTVASTAEFGINQVAQLPFYMLPVAIIGGAVRMAGTGIKYLTGGFRGQGGGFAAIENGGYAVGRFSGHVHNLTFGDIGDTLRIRKPLGSLTQKAADMVAPILPGRTSLGNRFARRNLKEARPYLKAIKEFEVPAMQGISKELQGHFDTLTELKTTTHVSRVDVPRVNAAVNAIEKHFATATPAAITSKAGALMQHANELAMHAGSDMVKAQTAFEALKKIELPTLNGISKELHGHFTTLKNVQNAAHINHVDIGKVTSAVTAIEKHLTAPGRATELAGMAKELAHHAGRARAYVNPGKAIKNAPAAVGQSNALNNASNAAWVGVSALGMFGIATGFTQQLTALRHMYADITGENYKNVSSFKVLFSQVPAPVATARSQLVKNIGAQAAVQGAWFGFSLKQFIGGGRLGKLGNAAQFGMMFAAPALMTLAPDSVLPVYDAARKAYASGEKLPPEFIAEFIGTASPELRKRGGTESAFTRELAKQYAAENASPAQIMKEIADGKMIERVKAITSAHKAAPAIAAAPQVSHVEKLNGKAEALPQPVGVHTQKEQSRRVETSQPGQTV